MFSSVAVAFCCLGLKEELTVVFDAIIIDTYDIIEDDVDNKSGCFKDDATAPLRLPAL